VKGYFWLATRWDFVGFIAQVGTIREFKPVGTWWGSQDKSTWPDEVIAQAKAENWDPFYQDRRQEIVIIGIDMNQESLRESLHAALLTDAEMQLGVNHWRKLPDPFPEWEFENEEELN
jgi:G3E family GTPase